MKQFKKEFLTQHLLVLCAMSIIGALVRNEAMQYGVDTFCCNLTFVISTTILMVVYLHALDSIVRLLAPWFKHIFCNTVNNTERKRLSSIAINETNTYDEGEELNLEDVTFVYADEASSCITSYEQLRQEALEDKAKKEKVLLNSAIDYTRRTFAAYMKEEHLNQLCDNIAIFQCCASTHMRHHSLIVDKAIRTIDLMHYAWNIGNLFKKKGIDTATFIKQVFADALVDVEISTIIRKLRMEGTYIIELLPSLDVQGGIKTHYCC
jgi:hypothetical protein